MENTPQSCELIIDKGREQMVSRHAHEFENIRWSEKTITTGDYAIVSPAGRLLAIVERKTLDDYGASIKDGRHANKQKLLAARLQTGCRIIYIVEGADPVTSRDPYGLKARCGGIPWTTIESSIIHLSLRDDIAHYRTRDSIHTAKMLAGMVRFYNSFLENSHDFPAPSPHAKEGSAEPTEEESPSTATHELLTQRHEKTTHQVVREMWACFQGISAESADEYMSNWSMRQVILSEIPRESLTSFRLPSGRKPSKNALNSITGVTRSLEGRILKVVPGISQVTASEITAKYSLKDFINMPVEEIAAVKIGKSQRALGEARAKKIIECFDYCTKPLAEIVVAEVAKN